MQITKLHAVNYRPDIDGLRAIAVMMVIGFHAFPSMFRGGFVGVDIFFVISGYLISAIILRSISNQTYSLKQFYRNRIKRIFPALLTVLIFCLITGWFLFTNIEFKQLGKHIAAGAVFVSNIIYMNERGYFDVSSETKPLLHLWSLSVEEQFYIVLPPLLWFLYKLKTQAIKIIILIATISFLISLFALSDPTIRFYSPQTRFWELLLGTIIAWTEQARSQEIHRPNPLLQGLFDSLLKRADFFSSLGLVLIVSSIVLIDRNQSTPGIWTLLPTLGASLLIVVGMKGWFNRALLSNRVFVAVGLISYPLYLWHWPLLVLTSLVEGIRPSITHRLIAIAITCFLSIATYFLIERPIRFGLHERIKTALLVVIMACVGVFGYTIYREDGYPERTFALEFKNITEAIQDWENDTGLIPATYLGQSVLSNSTLPPEILFIGDSHIEQFLPRIAKLTEQHRLPPSIFVLGAGCPPIQHVFESTLTWCPDNLKRIMAITEQVGSIKKIVVGGCWNCYFIAETKSPDSTGKVFNFYYQESGGPRENFRAGQGSKLAIDQLEKMLRKLSEKYKVYLLLDNPLGVQFSPQNLIGNRLAFRKSINLTETVKIDDEQRDLNALLKRIAHKAGVETIDQLSALCPEGWCIRLTKDKNPIYKDENHLRPFFVREHADYFEKQILR